MAPTRRGGWICTCQPRFVCHLALEASHGALLLRRMLKGWHVHSAIATLISRCCNPRIEEQPTAWLALHVVKRILRLGTTDDSDASPCPHAAKRYRRNGGGDRLFDADRGTRRVVCAADERCAPRGSAPPSSCACHGLATGVQIGDVLCSPSERPATQLQESCTASRPRRSGSSPMLCLVSPRPEPRICMLRDRRTDCMKATQLNMCEMESWSKISVPTARRSYQAARRAICREIWRNVAAGCPIF